MCDVDHDEKCGDRLIKVVKDIEDPLRAGVSFLQDFDAGTGDGRKCGLHERKERGQNKKNDCDGYEKP